MALVFCKFGGEFGILVVLTAICQYCQLSNCLHTIIIRRHARDIYLGMCPVQNDVSYLNVLAHFGETSQTAVAKNN